MPGKGDEMTIWTENGKQKISKHYLKNVVKRDICFLSW